MLHSIDSNLQPHSLPTLANNVAVRKQQQCAPTVKTVHRATDNACACEARKHRHQIPTSPAPVAQQLCVKSKATCRSIPATRHTHSLLHIRPPTAASRHVAHLSVQSLYWPALSSGPICSPHFSNACFSTEGARQKPRGLPKTSPAALAPARGRCRHPRRCPSSPSSQPWRCPRSPPPLRGRQRRRSRRSRSAVRRGAAGLGRAGHSLELRGPLLSTQGAAT